GEAALADAIVREHWARFRSGAIEGLPTLLLRIPAGIVGSDEARRALLPALASAAETGRVEFLIDRDELPPLATPWYRVRGLETTAGIAEPVGGAVALDVARLAEEGGDLDEVTLLERLEGLLETALKALRQKRNFLAELQSEPSMPLYRVAGGARPLMHGGAGVDLIHLCGVRAAARHLAGNNEETARLVGRLRSYAGVRISEESRSMRMRALLAADRDGEAQRRFAERLGGTEESVPDVEPAAPVGTLLPEEVAAVVEPVEDALLLRFPREHAPAPEVLHDLIVALAGDGRTRRLRLHPWPDRTIRNWAIRSPGEAL
ncbi:MAG: hypothetical protein AAGD14_10055, partial [Planctomycetota bacterium]